MNDPSFLSESTYFAINKHVCNGRNNQPLRSLSAIGTAYYSEKEHLLNHTSNKTFQRKSISINEVVSLQQPLITPDTQSQFQYSTYPAIQNLPSSLSSLYPQVSHLKEQRTNKKRKDFNRNKDSLASKSNILYAPRIGTILSKNKNESKPHKNTPHNFEGFSSKLHPICESLHSQNESFHPTHSATLMSNFTDTTEINYLELRTHDPLKCYYKILPINLPSPLINNTITLHPINTFQFSQDADNSNRYNHSCVMNNRNNSSSAKCIIEKLFAQNDQQAPYFLKACQFSLKGCDGLTRYSKVDFLPTK